MTVQPGASGGGQPQFLDHCVSDLLFARKVCLRLCAIARIDPRAQEKGRLPVRKRGGGWRTSKHD